MASTPDDHIEKGDETPSPPHHHHHSHRPMVRLLKFIHPHTGKTTHICPTPESVAKKRDELQRQETKEEFDVLLQGSPEHITAVRDLHAHHVSKNEELRQKHSEVYHQFDHVRNELDTLSAELHTLTDHAVALDASFDKFGYSAHLRTTDDSETNSLSSEHALAKQKHEDRSIEGLKFFKRPQIRQYFHKGLLWRSSRSGEVAAFELFVDLVYVGVIDHIGAKAVEIPDGSSILHFIIVFSIAWKIWADLTMVINWFEVDDIFQRVYVVFFLACLFGFTTNIAAFFDTTYISAVAFFLAQRLAMAIWFLFVSFWLPNIRGTMIWNAILIFFTSVLWIGSMHVEWPNQLALIFIPLFLDLFGGVSVLFFSRICKSETGVGRFLQKYFEFYPAINIEHRVERTNAFVALVFGYSVLTTLFQSHASFGINAFFGKGVLGLIQAFMFNWIYFEVDGYFVHVHAIRRHFLSATIWTIAHLPFIMSYVIVASTLKVLVLAHDCSDADPHTLEHVYEAASLAELEDGLRWYYCGGLGVALISMAVISFTHVHKKMERSRLHKRPRLVARVCIAIIIICLPLAHSLTSLDLIVITTCLVAFVLALDLYGHTSHGEKFLSGGFCDEEKKKCTYTANVKLGKRRRNQLRKALERGEQMNLEDLLKRQNSNTSLESEITRDQEWQGGHY